MEEGTVGVQRLGLKQIFAGGITGGVQICITYPMEYVKTKLQLDERGGRRLYSGSVDCAKKTIQSRGVLGLYRGSSILLLGAVPQNAVGSGVYEALRRRAVDEHGALTTRAMVMCGMAAGVCEAVLVVTPIETIKIKFISDRRLRIYRFRGFFHGVGLIVKEQGLRGIYQGITATIMRQSTNQGIRLFMIEQCKESYRGEDRTKRVPEVLIGVFGGIAGAVFVFANAPIDMVKTRMQSLESYKYTGTVDCFVKIWKKEGIAGFYKGTVPRMTRNCLEVATYLMVYDFVMEIINVCFP